MTLRPTAIGTTTPKLTATDALPAAAVASKVLGWPKRCKMAHALLWEHSDKRLKLAQLLGQLGVFLTCLQLAPPCSPYVVDLDLTAIAVQQCRGVALEAGLKLPRRQTVVFGC